MASEPNNFSHNVWRDTKSCWESHVNIQRSLIDMELDRDHVAEGGVWNPKYTRWEWRDSLYRYHRENGPAIISYLGQEWCLHGKFHRLDGPAVINRRGRQAWYLRGQRHREDGPAIIHADGRKDWYLHGKLHRVDGPARILPGVPEEWWLNNRNITQMVQTWMQDHNIQLPFTPEQQAEFVLRWG